MCLATFLLLDNVFPQISQVLEGTVVEEWWSGGVEVAKEGSAAGEGSCDGVLMHVRSIEEVLS
jgi:hypothetical protein